MSWHLGYAISRQSYLVKASARGPQGGKRAPFEKPWFRIFGGPQKINTVEFAYNAFGYNVSL